MKNLLIITGLIFSGSVFAQSSSNTCKRMDKMENILKDSIKITSEQQSKISTLHATYCPKFKAIGSSDKSKDEKKSEMKTLNKELKSKYKEILTEEQLKSLKEKKKSHKKHHKGKKDKRMDAQAMTDKMAEKLTLTEEQKPKVLALNQKLIADRKVIKDNSETDEVKKTSMKKLRKAYKADLKEVLTEEQLKKLKNRKGKK